MKFWKYMLKVIENKFVEFGLATAREKDKTYPFLMRIRALEYMFVVFGAAVLFTYFIPTLVFQAQRWFTTAPSVFLPESQWHVLYEAGKNCNGSILKAGCPGLPQNISLWQSPHLLSDNDHEALVKKMLNKKFWVGITITPDQAKKAFDEKAGVLYFGFFNAASRAFVNGTLAAEGNGTEDQPLSLHVSLDELNKSKEIKIAVEVNHNLNSRVPVWFGAQRTGFYKYKQAEAERNYWVFTTGYRTLIPSTLALLLSFLFISLWMSAPKKIEYFYYSLYLFVFFLIQFKFFGPIRQGLDRALSYPLDFWFRIVEGCLACLLGAAFARVSSIYLYLIILMCSTSGILGYYSTSDSVAMNLTSFYFAQIYVPIMFIIGAIFCVAQSFYLKKHKPPLTSNKARMERISRLQTFSALLIFLGVFYYTQASDMFSNKSQTIIHRPVQFLILMYVGYYIFLDYRKREQVFEITHRSPFHDPVGGNSSPVRGFLLALDLKKSSLLFNYAAEHSTSVRAPTLWNTLVGKIMAKNGGFKVSEEGDGLKIFFEGEETKERLDQIVSALLEVTSETLNIEKQLKSEGHLSPNLHLVFRAGLMWGGIQPIWKDIAGLKSAEWEDERGFKTFINTQRIMDFEKTLGEAGSNLIVASQIEISGTKKQNAHIRDVGIISISVMPLNSRTGRAA